MERWIMKDLVAWKHSPHRKPLILNGVRQVGKTWLLKAFAKAEYENLAYINFEENPMYKEFFQNSMEVGRLLQNLALASMEQILPHKTLIVLDEIQACPEALTSLKYFCENASDYHVACAGSLLGLALHQTHAFPVGKVQFLQVHPLCFGEFLQASGERQLAAYLQNIDSLSPLPIAFFDKLSEKLKLYYLTGGMPEVVHTWVETQDIQAVQSLLQDILQAYERDFAKHAQSSEYPKISMLWKSVPSQLARENKKFIYKVVKEGARAREYEDALQWLVNAGLLYKVYRSTAPRLPLSAYDDLSAFKLYLADVGLLRRLALLAPSAFVEGNRLFTEFKGALSENYILQALQRQFEGNLRYWSVLNPPYEVDFLLQRENDVFPIEVKAEDNIKSRSLQYFQKKFTEEVKLRIRFSLQNLKLEGDLLNVPLFMADQLDSLIELALVQLKRPTP